eukprot:TRINITY_DN3270_c0_g1_i2.p1 TRINITY_DN3270_c0_g1~~TRINITY_DN3270_c0_g1_i2.p1  ORF type:complete len:836 (-),score=434.04 TRINITY_DN3270_c0_g1_i2:63-2453(-)
MAAQKAEFPLPSWAQERIEYWEVLKAQKNVERESKPILIKLPDGKEVQGESFKTTPLDVAKGISARLAQNTIVAEVNGVLKDASFPLQEDCDLVLHTFESETGKKTFWHSSAHVLGEALEIAFNCHLTIGPPLAEGGFYYDMALEGEKKTITDADFPLIQQFVKRIIDQKQTFERLELSRDEALTLFKYNKYKVDLITRKIPEGGTISAYRCGPLVDLCKGPHVPDTGRIKAFEVTKNSSAYWLGKAENDVLQRVYGMSFPDKKLMTEWKLFQEEAKRRDHRNIGKQQELFFVDPLSPGSVFWLPHGARVYNRLIEFLRKAYRERGFEEVITPNMFNAKLWETSGHWQNYAENMFSFEVEGQQFALKPMNCPGHCVMFGHRARSYRELPIRFADFGVLHRNELSGALTGLTRVRRFQQDDAHIFCRQEQIEEELRNAMHFMEFVYGVFGFKFNLELSTRPEKFLGEIAVWNDAEAMMQSVLEKSGHPWKLNPGDGAFYGPKIDIHITDALRRSFQCATIQLDFQLPLRFNLEYQTEGAEGATGPQRPVIIHRAIYGSLERFTAILIEHLAGEWPIWLSPRQFVVIPVTDKFNEYAEQVRSRLHTAGFYVDVDFSTGRTFLKKIAVASSIYTYVLVVGNSEHQNQSVNVRRKTHTIGEKTIDQLIVDAHAAFASYKSLIYDVPDVPDADASASSSSSSQPAVPKTNSKAQEKKAPGRPKKLDAADLEKLFDFFRSHQAEHKELPDKVAIKAKVTEITGGKKSFNDHDVTNYKRYFEEVSAKSEAVSQEEAAKEVAAQ